jgi:multicomponent Na+:H+ antiporter subunit B
MTAMSRPIPEEEYNRKPLTRLIQWVGGTADPFRDNMETRVQPDYKPNERLLRKHRRDRDEVIMNVYDQKHNKVYKGFIRFYKIASVVCCFALILMLLTAVSFLPPVGAADNPTSNEVAAKYIEDGLQDTGAVNIVTGMILDYRAFDTFGESNVLFIATCTVLILLRSDKKKEKHEEESEQRIEQHYEPKDDDILQKVTFYLFPVIAIYGIYVILNGHISPGGGFSGGAIIGAGLILYANAFGFEKLNRFFTEKTYKWISFASLSFYCLAKSYSFFTGANHLESGIPLGEAGAILSAGLILPLNICVGMVVACTMYAFYTLFRKGGF